MFETPQAGAPRTPSSSHQARCEPADDMDSVPSQVPQQQRSPPPYHYEATGDQPLNDGQPFNTFHPMQNMFDHYFDINSASQEPDPTIADLEQGFYQACAQHLYTRFMQRIVNGSGRPWMLFYFMQLLQHQFPNGGSNNQHMTNQEMDE